MEPKRPTFIIIGSAKCGTTALASILGNHPDCCMSRPKEVSFFQDSVDFLPNPNLNRGWEWYQNAFAHYSGEPVVGEATPSYSDRSRSPNTARRIFEFNPKMKIIYMVRDPLERQISAWRMQYAFGIEKSAPWRREDQWALRGFQYWMERQKGVDQWSECCYGYQLEAYLDCFPGNQIFVTSLEDWRIDKWAEVEKSMTFLGLESKELNRNSLIQDNRNEERRVDRAWLRVLRRNSVGEALIQLVPEKVRNRVRNRVVKKRVRIPEAVLCDSVRDEFLKKVEADMEASQFLQDRLGSSLQGRSMDELG